jgi:hypothetical protein
VTKDTPRLHYTQQESRYPTGWASGPVWTGLGEDKIFPHRDSNSEPSSPYRFAIPTTLLRPLLLQTYNRKNPSHLDPAIEWASQSAPHVKFVFLDTSGSTTAEKILHSVLKPQFQLHSYRHIPSSPSTTASQQFDFQVADSVPNDINPNVDAVAKLTPLFANSMAITASSKMTVFNARNINMSKTCFVCSQNVA